MSDTYTLHVYAVDDPDQFLNEDDPEDYAGKLISMEYIGMEKKSGELFDHWVFTVADDMYNSVTSDLRSDDRIIFYAHTTAETTKVESGDDDDYDGNSNDPHCAECGMRMEQTGRLTWYCPDCNTCPYCGCPDADGFSHNSGCKYAGALCEECGQVRERNFLVGTWVMSGLYCSVGCAVEEYEDARKQFSDPDADWYIEVECTSCGTWNDVEETNCEECGAVLAEQEIEYDNEYNVVRPIKIS